MLLEGHLAKDCLDLREEDGEGFEGVSSTADFLLMDNSEDEEGEGGSGFNDIRMIFDDDTEEEGEGEEEEERNSSKSFDKEFGNQPEDSISENNPNMHRYALLSIIHMIWLSELTIYETLQLNLPCYQGFERGQSDTFGE